MRTFHGALEDYLRALQERFADLDLTGKRILLDCANGATFRAAPEIFRRLGADIGVLAHEPDGRNINHDCGSTHMDRLRAGMQTGDDVAGFAFDGDGDRMLAVDRQRRRRRRRRADRAGRASTCARPGRLPGNGVAVTVMTNYGFHTAMAEHGVEVAITSVGDRYVLEALREREWALGGEQSGHIIDRNFVPSGDGIAAALLTLEALGDSTLADRHAMEKLPQTLVNVRVRDRGALERRARGPRGGRARVRRRSKAAAACCCARAAPSRSCA